MDKCRLEKRISEIKRGYCPDCGGKLIVSYEAGYIFCENQHYKGKKLFGKTEDSGNYCTGMITSLKILREEVEKHGLEMPDLSVFLNDGVCDSGGYI